MTWRTASRWLLTILFLIAGTFHLIAPEPFLRIMPPDIPYPKLMVAFSGVAEILGGAGLAIARTRRAAAQALILLLICVFPANVYMAAHHISPGGVQIPAWLLWMRLPLQPLIMWWLITATQYK